MVGTIVPVTGPPAHSEPRMEFESVPREVGVLLIVAGIGGVLLPGPVGAPFLLMGGIVLFPKVFRKLDGGFRSRFPRIHQEGVKQARRFLVDLERRYPSRP